MLLHIWFSLQGLKRSLGSTLYRVGCQLCWWSSLAVWWSTDCSASRFSHRSRTHRSWLLVLLPGTYPLLFLLYYLKFTSCCLNLNLWRLFRHVGVMLIEKIRGLKTNLLLFMILKFERNRSRTFMLSTNYFDVNLFLRRVFCDFGQPA